MIHFRGLKRISAGFLAFLMVCLFLVPENKIIARDSFVSQYIQTVYNQQNGIGSSEVNCLYQSSSGYIWIGTDGGLYRSKGSEFQSINLWDTDRTDVYFINCLMQDASGRMWVGTDNYGLFYIENGESYHLQEEYYSGIKNISDICETEDGTIYVSSPTGLYTCHENEENKMVMEKYIDTEVSGIHFIEISAKGNEVWAINGYNSVYVLGKDAMLGQINMSDVIADELSCIDVIGEKVYVGTTGRDILEFSNLGAYNILTANIDSINRVMKDDKGNTWICGDNGIGFFDVNGNFIKANDCAIDSYITDVIQDYEGNYWFSSKRMGVLLLNRSKFRDFNMYTGMQDTMVNSVFIGNKDKYIGTDDGLIIFDENNEKINNELTDMLSGISVRHVIKDSYNTLWIGTYRKYGIVRVSSSGGIEYFTRASGLPSTSINYLCNLKDGNIAVATDNGVAIMDRYGAFVKSYTKEQGLEYDNVTCLYEKDDGVLFAGTDGGGIYAINTTDDTIINYNTEDGINSNVITSIIEGEEGIWIGTDNGICFFNESFRQISNIEYSNAIYDIEIYDDVLWIISSMGIICATEEELRGSQGIERRYLDAEDGLTKTLNSDSDSFIDKNGNLYICCNQGICMLDTANIPYNTVAPKIKVTAVDVDGQLYEMDDLADGLKIDSDVSRITIDFAVFSYSNRSNIQVEYYLSGFDEEPIVVRGNDAMRAVYTNLDGGVYSFRISALNGDGTPSEEEISFTIEKELSFFENKIARIVFVVIIVLSIFGLIYALLVVNKILRNKNSAIEKLSKEHEEAVKSSSAKNDYLANMSNEIKIPINAIVARAGELLQITDENDASYASIKSIYESGNGIIEKMDDIILLAKIEAGKQSVINSPYSVSSLVYEVADEAINKIGDKPIKFFVELGDNVQDLLIGDHNKVKEILARLLDNAVRYTKEGSVSISVDCFAYADKQHHDMVNIVFTISDTGIGIQENKLEDIFKVYNIAENVKNSIHAGIGVSLAISKGYADLMGAELDAESVYGAGSTFTLAIDQRLPDRNSVTNRITKIEDTVTKETADKLWLPDVCALVVDDENVSREVSVKVLEKFEMKIDVASSGLGAIDMVLNNSYDVVFLDLSMPVMNGIEVMKEIRELSGDNYEYLPIIAMDTNAIEEDKAGLLEEGFTDSLLKPLDARRVAAILKDCLPQEKIKERTNDIDIYIEGSRFGEGLENLKPYIDVAAAVERIGGSIDVFNRLLKAYYSQNASSAQELSEKQGKDARGFRNKIHAVKTSSINIGAIRLAHEASNMEAAVNIGNRDYIKDNIDVVIDYLNDTLSAIEEYLEYVDKYTGISDGEYAIRKQREKEKESETCQTQGIDFSALENIKYAALDGDYETVCTEFDKLEQLEYTGEDKEFMEVLREAVYSENTAVIDEIITTYIDLNM